RSQSGFVRGARAREMALLMDVRTLNVPFGGPGAARKPDLREKRETFALSPKFSDAGGAAVPGGTACQTGTIRAGNPGLSEDPSGGFTHLGQHGAQGRVQILRAADGEGHGLQQSD